MDRRTFLKIAAAGSSALGVTAFVPEKWVKPLVRTGVLPAHAQASNQPPTIANADLSYPNLTFDYNDPLGKVSGATYFDVVPDTDSVTPKAFQKTGLGRTLTSLGAVITGTGFTGTIQLNVVTQYSLTLGSYIFAIADTATGQRMSNVLGFTVEPA